MDIEVFDCRGNFLGDVRGMGCLSIGILSSTAVMYVGLVISMALMDLSESPLNHSGKDKNHGRKQLK